MKAVRITEHGDPDVLKIERVEPPTCGPDDLLVDVRATALNRADLMQRRGEYPAPEGTRPDVPGLEFAGVVRETGPRIRTFEKGQRVFGLLPGGGYAQQVRIPGNQALPIPESLSFEQAAAVPEVFITAFDALFLQMELGVGERLLIHAVGSGVGTAAVQLANQAGVSRIFGTASGPKLPRAKELGLDVGIDYRNESFRERVLEETGGDGVHVILDVVGADYWDANVECLAPTGRMILVGLLSGGRTEVDLSTLLLNRLQVVGTVLRSRASHEKARVIEQFQRRVLPLFEQEHIKPVIDRVMELSEAAEAHRIMENNENLGKIILSVPRDG